jgi:hypothetical protein
MKKENILDKLVTKANFHKYVEICLSENIDIKLKYAPEINIYLEGDGNWIEIVDYLSYIPEDKYNLEFEVFGDMLTGTNNFFKYYKDITKFVLTLNYEVRTYLVIPDLIDGKHWIINEDEDWQEISYDCHSYSKPAHIIDNGKTITEEYYINGRLKEKEEFLKISREHKLKRILKND